MKIFLDANIIIYVCENDPEFGPTATETLMRFLDRGDEMVVSCMVVGELLVGAKRYGDNRLQTFYSSMLESSNLMVADFPKREVEVYATIRTLKGVKSADAMNLACASAIGVDVFLTNDKRLHDLRIAGIGRIAGLDDHL